MLRIDFLQQWFSLSDPAMQEALYDNPLYCEFARLDRCSTRLPDESTLLRFRRLLEQNNLSHQLLFTINATLIAASISTKKKTGSMTPGCTRPKRATSGTLA